MNNVLLLIWTIWIEKKQIMKEITVYSEGVQFSLLHETWNNSSHQTQDFVCAKIAPGYWEVEALFTHLKSSSSQWARFEHKKFMPA